MKTMLMLLAIALCIALIGVSALTVSCGKDHGGMTLEQQGMLVNLAAKTTIIEASLTYPGDWIEPVCEVASMILERLEASTTSTLSWGEHNAAVMELSESTRGLDLDMRRRIETALVALDIFLGAQLRTEFEIWFLTTEFFRGLVAGCQYAKGDD